MPKVSCDLEGSGPPRQAISPATSVIVQPSLASGLAAVTPSGSLMRSAVVAEPPQPCETRKPAVNDAPAMAVLGWATTCAMAAATGPAATAQATSAPRKNDIEISLRQTNEDDALKASGVNGQAKEGGPRGRVGPSRIPTGVGCSAATSGAMNVDTGASATNERGGAAIAETCARPRQHSCALAVMGTGLDLPSESAAVELQKTVHKVDGAPSRIIAAWASGCRKLSVIANSATASAIARQPWSERSAIMPGLCPVAQTAVQPPSTTSSAPVT